jgi:ribosomal-protein-alanine N-acetyltransferase
MSLNDIDGIMEIETASFKIPWSRNAFISELTTNEFAVYLVAKIEDRVVGYAGMWKILDEGHITNIAVHPDFRGRKIGQGLVETLVSVAKEKNIGKLTLEVRKSNDVAQGLYGKFGFEVLGVRKKYYSDNQEDALIMWMAV